LSERFVGIALITDQAITSSFRRLQTSIPLMKSFTFVSGMAVLAVAAAFQPNLPLPTSVSTSTRSPTALDMANSADNDKFMRYDKAKRSASASDTVIELVRPLGLVLNQDAGGNVFVEKVAPKGNAARTGLVS
jgi:hypothetical protein